MKKFYLKKITQCIIFLFLSNAYLHGQCVFSGTSLSATTVQTNINCTSSDGTITVNAINGYTNSGATNGTGYSYAITGGSVIRPSQSSNIFSALPAGNYTVSVTDCNGTVVSLNNKIISGTPPSTITYNPTTYKSICSNNNAVKLAPSGGRPPYTITVVSAPAGSLPFITADTIRGLTAGSLTAQITDACGNSISPVITITSNPSLPSSNNIPSAMFYFGCAGSTGFNIGNGQNSFATNAGIAYSIDLQNIGFDLASSSAATKDSFYTDVYFNGTLVQTYKPTPYNYLSYYSLYLNNFPFYQNSSMMLMSYGYGDYLLKSYYKCGGSNSYTLFKTDEAVLGDRNDGTNVHVPGTWASLYNCTNYTEVYGGTTGRVFGGGPSGNIPTVSGLTYDVNNGPYTATIIAGPDHLGSVYSYTSGDPDSLYITGLTYGAAPAFTYTVQIKDNCGVLDTISFNALAPTVIKQPTGNFACDALGDPSMVLGKVIANLGRNGRTGIPTIAPYTYTLLGSYINSAGTTYTGTPIPWLKGPGYPVTIVDTTGGTIIIIPAINPQTTLIVAYQNGCGLKDTTVWTMNCTPTPPGTITNTVTPQCGNKGTITLTNATTNQPLDVNTINAPQFVAMNRQQSSVVTPNLSSGIYNFAAYIGSDNYNNGTTDDYIYTGIFREQFAEASSPIIAMPNYPILPGTPHISATFNGTVDTSKLKLWDTTFSVTVPLTSIAASPPDNYICKSSRSNAYVLAHTVGVSPFTFAYSTVGSDGPYTTNSTPNDSLISIAGIAPGAPVWIKASDPCGNTVISTTAVSSLSTTVSTNCNAGIATITPSPFTASFAYELVNTATSQATTFYYPVKPTIDLNNSGNAGKYTLRYTLTDGTSTGCVADSDQLTVASPCTVVLPIALTTFNGTLTGCKAELTWETATEQNSNRFEIEHSNDATNFTKVGTVISNNLFTGGSYNFSLADLFQGKNYFRLKLVDRDGQYTYSPVIAIINYNNCNAEIPISVSPNPVNDILNIRGLVDGTHILLLNAAGKRLNEFNVSGPNTAINMASYANGVYLLQILKADASVQNIKLIKD